LKEARNNPDALEDRTCAAFRSLGFEVIPLGKSGKPDGVATANLAGSGDGIPGEYSVSLEAKSTVKDGKKVSNGTVAISSVIRHRDDYKCHHAIVVGPSFQTTGEEKSALAKEIEDDRAKTKQGKNPKTITLMTIDDLAELVRLRPVKRLGLKELRGLFECRLPEESAAWVQAIKDRQVTKPPYKKIIETIQELQKEFKNSSVQYSALQVALARATPPIKYDPIEELIELCKALAQMAPGAMYANQQTVELDQSAVNVIDIIEAAMRDYNDSGHAKDKS
jgi:hypothetical protein